MLHALLRGEPLLVVIDQQIVQQIVKFGADVARLDPRRELGPIATSTAPQARNERFVHLEIVLLDVAMQIGRAQNVHNHAKLVVVAVGTKEGEAIKDHAGHDAPEGPHVD